MRIARYQTQQGGSYGAVVGEEMRRLVGDPYTNFEIGDVVAPLDELKLLSPCIPSKIVCVGANYRTVLESRDRPWPEYPFTFLKAPNAVVGTGEAIVRPTGIEELVYEGEACLVIGKPARRLNSENYHDHILGVTCGNDVTVRDFQNSDGQWLRAKSLDTHCALGPWIETEISVNDDLRVRTRVNDELRQDGNTSDLLFNVAEVLTFVTEWMTLEAGDVVMTGTPLGAGPMEDGDRVEIEVDGIGVLTNTVIPADTGS